MVRVGRPEFRFLFKDGAGRSVSVWENDALRRSYRASPALHDIWCRADNAFVYDVCPRRAEAGSAAHFLATLTPADRVYVPDTDGRSGLGANRAARRWGVVRLVPAERRTGLRVRHVQRVATARPPEPARFHELRLYRGYFGIPNLWLGVVPQAAAGDEYKSVVLGGVPRNGAGGSSDDAPTRSPAGLVRISATTTR